tara:strand:+ start:781 stop:2247 length:1467 start_codon:yes stop_codon:yes gene_type:complete
MRMLDSCVPNWSWAFPQGSHHQLIDAAIGCDDIQSLEAAHHWLTDNDIDDASFRDHRLLLAVMERFKTQLRRHSAYPRLIGLQRQLWSRSMMTLHEAQKSLRRIAERGHAVMLIKGASAIAAAETRRKQRFACDIDAVVKPTDVVPVFEILVEDGWIPSPGTSPQYLRERLSATRSINLFKGNWGDFDLHSRPFHPGQGGQADDDLFWDAARVAQCAGVPLWIPQPEDRVALAIAHGGLDGHSHSDWMVDLAVLMQQESLNWSRLAEIIVSRRIEVPASVTFEYFRTQLGYPIPASFLRPLFRSASSNCLRKVTGLVQCRPKEQFGITGKIVRGITKKCRKVKGARLMPAQPKDRLLKVRRISYSATSPISPPPLVTSYSLGRPRHASDSPTRKVEIVLEIEPTTARRRFEWEICSPDTHHCRGRFRTWTLRETPLRLHLSGVIRCPSADCELTLMSRPSRQLRDFASELEKQRYNEPAFRVLSCQVS